VPTNFGWVDAFEVLGDPVRRSILQHLAEGETASGTLCALIQAEFGITQSAVSQHLRVLRESGFATVRTQGARRLYAVSPQPLQEIHVWLNRFRRFWAPHLAALAAELTRGKRERELDPGRHDQHTEGSSMPDIVQQINAVQRAVGTASLAGGEARVASLIQSYDGSLDDVWDAITNSERIPRWFLPVSGDLRLGGRFQIENNAGGTIEVCDPRTHFAATWEFGGSVSRIAVRLSAESDQRTRLELEHTVPADPERWAKYGPGDIGVGWDLTFSGLAGHLSASGAGSSDGPLIGTERGRQFMQLSSDAWRDASIAAGTDKEDAQAAADRVFAFYTGTGPGE
jgi:DNA-binding transcriptional ArsR family regulator/uncharacterized protein YndB with AHSA1/START domain